MNFSTERALGWAKLVFAGISAATFFSGTFMDDKNTLTMWVWRLSAGSGLIAYLTESELARRDRKEAERLRSHVADLNLLAAQATQRAAEASLQLEKFKTPRSLNPKQQARIADAVRQFPGIVFDVAVSTGHREAIDLLSQLEDALRAAGWVQIDWKTPHPMSITFSRANRPVAGVVSMDGVLIQMHAEQIPRLMTVANFLADALTSVGVAAQSQFGLGVENANPPALHVLVGQKLV